jgi:hypothetical protein
MTTRIPLSAPVKVNIAGLVVAAAGILIQYFSGVEGFPTIPPGPFILLAAALIAWGPWRWTAAVGVLVPLLSLVLGTMSTILNWETTAPLSDPSETVGFVGAVIQFLGLITALGAGIVAVMHAPRVRT